MSEEIGLRDVMAVVDEPFNPPALRCGVCGSRLGHVYCHVPIGGRLVVLQPGYHRVRGGPLEPYYELTNYAAQRVRDGHRPGNRRIANSGEQYADVLKDLPAWIHCPKHYCSVNRVDGDSCSVVPYRVSLPDGLQRPRRVTARTRSRPIDS